MNTTQQTPNKSDLKYFQELNDLHNNYTRQNSKLLKEFTGNELSEQIDKLNNWYDTERQKLVLRSKIRDGASELEQYVEKAKDQIYSAWETLKQNARDFFGHDKKKPATDMWDAEAEDVNYMEKVKQELEFQTVYKIVQNQLLEMYKEKEAAKEWDQSAADVYHLEQIKNKIDQEMEKQKLKTNSSSEFVTVSPNQQAYPTITCE